jgi:hypothetical protein
MGLLDRTNGFIQQTDADVPQLEAAGYKRCYTNDWKKRQTPEGVKVNVPCPFWLSPETVSMVQNQMGGYYSCPVCKKSYDLLSHMTWHGVNPDEAEANQREDMQAQNWSSGGGTHIGLKMTAQAEIGENLIRNIGTLGEYGPITWWHDGGAASNSPLDGATKDWGIEVKTIGYDALHHRFIPGGKRKLSDGTFRDEKQDKDDHAVQMGKLGVLGVLVLLDYRRNVADIYVREYPTAQGVGSFRSKNGTHLIKEIPFNNPLMDPHDPQPHVQTGTQPFKDDPVDQELEDAWSKW